MADEVGKLHIKIEASALSATKAIDTLVTRLNYLNQAVGRGVSGLMRINMSLREMAQSSYAFSSTLTVVSENLKSMGRSASTFSESIRGMEGSTRFMTTVLNRMTRFSSSAAIETMTTKFESFMGAVRQSFGSLAGMSALLSNMTGGFTNAGTGVNAFSRAFVALDERLQSVYAEASQTNRILGNLSSNLSGYMNHASAIRSTEDPFKRTRTGAESLSKELRVTSRAISKVLSGLYKLSTAGFKAVGSAMSNATGRLTGFFRGLVRIAKYRAIRAALRAITDGLKTGIENLYHFSEAYNTNFAPTMDKLSSSMLYLKNAFGSMFSPFLEYFRPAIEAIVDKIVDAFNWVQKLFSQLTGRAIWYKAVKVQKKYKESTEDTAKSVKALREELRLMDFDELNNITESPDNSSPAAKKKKEEPDPTTMFTIEETPNPMQGTLWENIKKKLYEWLGKNGWLNEDGTINWKAIGTSAGEAIGEWFANQDWAGIWNSIKETIVNIWDFLSGFTTGLIGKIFPGSVKDGEIDWSVVGDTIGEKIRTWIEKIDWQAVFSTLVDILKGIWDLIDGLFDGLFPERKAAKEANARLEGVLDLYNRVQNDRSMFTSRTVGSQNLLDKYFTLRADQSELRTKASEISGYFAEYLSGFTKEQIAEFEYNYEDLLYASHGGDVGERALKQDGYFQAYYQYRNWIEEFEKTISELEGEKNQNYRWYTGAETPTPYKKYSDERVDYAINGFIDDLSDAIRNGGGLSEKIDEIGERFSEMIRGSISRDRLEGFAYEALKNVGGSIGERYRDEGEDALAEFISGVDWKNGGTATKEEIAKAFTDAGLPDEYAEIASKSASAFIEDNRWALVGEMSASSIDGALSKAGIPLWYRTNAENSIKEYLNGVDWDEPGSLSADRIKSALDNAALPEKYKAIAAESISAMLSADWRNAGVVASRSFTSGFNLGDPSAKLRSLVGSDRLVPHFAAGGYPTVGTMFVAGEAGAEFVGNINGRTGVVGGREISGIGDAVWSTGGTTANLLAELISVMKNKEFTISPSASLGKVVARSQRLYATQTG